MGMLQSIQAGAVRYGGCPVRSEVAHAKGRGDGNPAVPMRVGERAAVCCVTMYVCACMYRLLDVADVCRNRHFHDYKQVP